MKFNPALFWLAFPAIVLIACVFYSIDAHEEQKKRRNEEAQG